MNIFIIFFSKILVDLQISSVDYGVFFYIIIISVSYDALEIRF